MENFWNDILRTASESQQIRYQNSTSGARDLEFDRDYLADLIELYCIDKWSVNRIASYFNKSCSFVNKRLKENNIIIRKRSENNEKPFKSKTNGL